MRVCGSTSSNPIRGSLWSDASTSATSRRPWEVAMAQLIGISRGRKVTVTENSRNGGFAASVVIRNAVVPNH